MSVTSWDLPGDGILRFKTLDLARTVNGREHWNVETDKTVNKEPYFWVSRNNLHDTIKSTFTKPFELVLFVNSYFI